MLEEMLVVLLVCVILSFPFLLFKKKNEKIKSLSGFPIFGHMLGTFTQSEHFVDILQRTYNAFPEQRYVGFRNFTSPVVVIRDLEIIKHISTRDFNYFQDHLGFVDKKMDPLFGNNLFSLTGQKWHDMRYTLSPVFTISKIKEMVGFMNESVDQMVGIYLEKVDKATSMGKDFLDVEMKDAFTRYTNDVIATMAFGIRVNSLLDKNSEFFRLGKLAISQTRLKPEFTRLTIVKMVMMASCPNIMKFFKRPVFSPEISKFFKSLIQSAMKVRTEGNAVRRDMIQMLMDAKKDTPSNGNVLKRAEEESDNIPTTVSDNRKWSDDEITAQAMIFFISGFETSSLFLSFVSYELATHPEIQRKLQAEIDEVSSQNSGEIDYTVLQNMKYLKMVVSETLRVWPPAVFLDRKCKESYKLPPPCETSGEHFTLKKNAAVWIPVYGIHHDPEHFVNPEMFDPERFSDERVKEIKPYSYLPFGAGPRACLGFRFALVESKYVIFKLLQNFDFVVSPKTPVPIKLKRNSFNLYSENGIWIGLKKRHCKQEN